MSQNKGEGKKQQKFYPKNNQRGSQSLSNLSNTSERKTASGNSGSKPKNTYFQKTNRAPPRAPPRAFNQSTPNVHPKASPRTHPQGNPGVPYQPPSYEESVRQQVSFANQPFSCTPPLLNNPYNPQEYSRNYPPAGAGYAPPLFSRPPLYGNYPPQPSSFHQQRPYFNGPQQQRPFHVNGPQQQRFPTGQNFTKISQPQKTEAPKPIPRKSIQKNENTDSTDSKSQKQTKDDKINIDINTIVRKLSDCDKYFSFLKDLSQKLEMNSSDLLKIVKEKDHVFSTIYDSEKKDSMIEFCPKIKLCKYHQENGCDVKDCSEIHLCEDFIFSDCKRADCPLGHLTTFKSNHNVNVLKNYYMAILPNTTLQQIFQKVCSRTVSFQICFDYHQGKCQFADNCRNIHICYSYINNLGLCSNDNCSFNHNIRDSKITAAFKSLGVSTNESPRDLLKILKDKCIEKEKEKENIITSEPLEASFVVVDKQECLGKDAKKSRNRKQREAKKSGGVNQQTENCTKHCTSFYGTVKIPKVCMDGLKLNCKYIHNACHYLHCRHKSHWQFGNGDKWFNFHVYHSQILDSKFSNPNCEDVNLPNVDFSRLNPSQRNLIPILGSKSLKVDFIKMTFYSEATGTTYSIRNLTTDSKVLCKNDSDLDNYTEFKWYFKDDDGQYIPYPSANIEKDYVQNPNSSTKFVSTIFSYLIDFAKMTQENENTRKIRPLKRRPFILRSEKTDDKNKKDPKEEIQLPKTWDDMKNETFKRVKLNTSDSEYNDIRQILFLTLPQINIINIYRVQNIFLFQKYKNKQTALERQYNDNFLNIQKLFHGINDESVDDIVRENFEFRRHSITSDRPYGEGTYFYNSASAGSISCSPDSTGKKILLIAEVIIGKVAQGSSGLTRPPENPMYNSMYDSTTDNVQNPSVYVKYSTLEYYPAYIVEFC